MSQMSYNRVSKKPKSHPNSRGGGFRLNTRRFSVQRLRARFMFLFKIFNRLRFSYGQAVNSIKKGCFSSCSNGGLKRNSSSSSSKRGLVAADGYNYNNAIVKNSKSYNSKSNNVVVNGVRVQQFGRSNSFYAEAIADCLEFIKRSSVSVDQ